MKKPFDLILISSENDRQDEAKAVSKLFKLGLKKFHLRKPHWSEGQLNIFLEEVPNEYHGRVIIHSHFSLSEKFRLKGIHLNEANRKLIAEWKQYKIISASFHSLQALQENTFPYQYIFLSPVFDSISKPNHSAGFDLTSLQAELDILRNKKSSLKIIALGGIDEKNILVAKDIGFNGAALLGTVWQANDPVKAFLEIHSLIREL
jgi:thiamine-phosphate pyrophosphorylase